MRVHASQLFGDHGMVRADHIGSLSEKSLHHMPQAGNVPHP
jgi:hypothetical protein